MTDERNIAHDKTVADDKSNRGIDAKGDAAVQPQPGKKPPQVEAGNDPSLTRAHEMYKQGETPKDKSHQSVDNPPDGEQREKGREGTQVEL